MTRCIPPSSDNLDLIPNDRCSVVGVHTYGDDRVCVVQLSFHHLCCSGCLVLRVLVKMKEWFANWSIEGTLGTSAIHCRQRFIVSLGSGGRYISVAWISWQHPLDVSVSKHVHWINLPLRVTMTLVDEDETRAQLINRASKMMIEKERDFFIILLVDVKNRRQMVKGYIKSSFCSRFTNSNKKEDIEKENVSRQSRLSTVGMTDSPVRFIRSKCNEILWRTMKHKKWNNRSDQYRLFFLQKYRNFGMKNKLFRYD